MIYDSDGVELQSQMASEHTNMLPLLNIGDSLNVIIEDPKHTLLVAHPGVRRTHIAKKHKRQPAKRVYQCTPVVSAIGPIHMLSRI